MKKKLLSAILSVAMVATVLAGCGGSSSSTGESTTAGDSAAAVEEGSAAASTNTSTDGVKITILNTKSEIQTQWEELAQECRGFRNRRRFTFPGYYQEICFRRSTDHLHGRHSGYHYAG